MKASKIPTGISVGLNTERAIVSATTTNNPPPTAEAGSKYLYSPPIIKRKICGTTKPTKPTKPATLTAIPAKSVLIIIKRSDSALYYDLITLPFHRLSA